MKYIAIGIFVLGIGVLIHQNFMCNAGWFNWSQFWHHENLAVVCFVSSISLLVGGYLRRK